MAELPNPPTPPIPLLNPLATPFQPPLATPSSPHETWSKKLFTLDHIPELQRLRFTPPVRKGDLEVALCSKDEVNKTEDRWKDAVHGFFADKRPFFPAILSALEKSWKVKGTMEAFQRPDDSIVFIFSSLEERSRILGSGPWFVLGRYLHLRPWSRSIRSRKEFFATMPVWIRLPNLLLHLWSPDSIGKIASVVGKPLYLDNVSANSSKIRFVRVCVEISADKNPPASVQVEVEGSSDLPYFQEIEYESSFKLCTSCKVFGHVNGDCLKSQPSLLTIPSKNPQAKKQSHTGLDSGSKVLSGNVTSKSQDQPEKGWTLVQNKKIYRKKDSVASRINDPNSDTNPRESSRTIKKQVAGDLGHPSATCGLLENVERPNQGNDISQEISIAVRSKEAVTLASAEHEKRSIEIVGESTASGSNEDEDSSVGRKEQSETENPGLVSGESGMPSDVPVQMGSATKNAEITYCSSVGTPAGLMENPVLSALEICFGEESVLRPADGAVSRAIPVDHMVESPRRPAKSDFLDSIFVNLESTSVSRAEPSSDPKIPITSTSHSSPQLLCANQPGSQLLCANLPNPSSLPPNPSLTHSMKTVPNPSPTTNPSTLLKPNTNLVASSSEEELDSDFPPGFTPSKEEMDTLKSLMKEGVSLVPLEHQRDFIDSVDCAEDGEILEFFREKFNEHRVTDGDSNFVTHHNIRRSPRVKKIPVKLIDSVSSLGLKKGFFK